MLVFSRVSQVMSGERLWDLSSPFNSDDELDVNEELDGADVKAETDAASTAAPPRLRRMMVDVLDETFISPPSPPPEPAEEDEYVPPPPPPVDTTAAATPAASRKRGRYDSDSEGWSDGAGMRFDSDPSTPSDGDYDGTQVDDEDSDYNGRKTYQKAYASRGRGGGAKRGRKPRGAKAHRPVRGGLAGAPYAFAPPTYAFGPSSLPAAPSQRPVDYNAPPVTHPYASAQPSPQPPSSISAAYLASPAAAAAPPVVNSAPIMTPSMLAAQRGLLAPTAPTHTPRRTAAPRRRAVRTPDSSDPEEEWEQDWASDGESHKRAKSSRGGRGGRRGRKPKRGDDDDGDFEPEGHDDE